jgi:hypothetical protein
METAIMEEILLGRGRHGAAGRSASSRRPAGARYTRSEMRMGRGSMVPTVPTVRGRLASARPGKTGTARGYHPGIHASPVETAQNSSVLDFHAAVHDDVEARSYGTFRGFMVDDSKLHPQDVGADGDRIVGDGADFRGFTEAVDEIHVVWNRTEVRIAFLSQHFGVARIHRDDPVPVVFHVLRREVARAMPLGRQADDRQRARSQKNATDAGDVVNDGQAFYRRSLQFGRPPYG